MTQRDEEQHNYDVAELVRCSLKLSLLQALWKFASAEPEAAQGEETGEGDQPSKRGRWAEEDEVADATPIEAPPSALLYAFDVSSAMVERHATMARIFASSTYFTAIFSNRFRSPGASVRSALQCSTLFSSTSQYRSYLTLRGDGGGNSDKKRHSASRRFRRHRVFERGERRSGRAGSTERGRERRNRSRESSRHSHASRSDRGVAVHAHRSR
jgi:hypothetical protein